MRILLACDSFKDSFDSVEINSFLKEELEEADSRISALPFPVSDGGEGAIDVLHFHGMGEIRDCPTVDPLLRPIQSKYLLDSSARIAYIEMAKTAGLELLKKKERNCFHTTSYGLGVLIKDAIAMGMETIFLFVGGSATNDCGIGMAEALGYRFYARNEELKRLEGRHLVEIDRIEKGKGTGFLSGVNFHLLSDVRNPLTGPTGAAHTYAQQKGAGPEEIGILEQGALRLMDLIEQDFQQEGAGAAGGMGFGAQVFLGASMKGGAEYIFEKLALPSKLKDMDLVITGEGKLDNQTIYGKLVAEIAAQCKAHQIKTVAIAALNDISQEDLEKIHLEKVYTLYESDPGNIDREDTMRRLKATAKKIVKDNLIIQ